MKLKTQSQRLTLESAQLQTAKFQCSIVKINFLQKERFLKLEPYCGEYIYRMKPLWYIRYVHDIY